MSFDHIHQCPRCELKFEYRGELEDHLRADHAPPEERPIDPTGAEAYDACTVRILAAVDPHRPASPAGEIAGRLAHRIGASLDLVSVVPPDLPADLVDAYLAAEANRQPFIPLRTTRLEGDVVETLLSHIAGTEPTLVVLDSHGRRAMAEVLLGSVSADIVRSSQVPTLVVGPHSSLGATVEKLVVAIDGSDDAKGAFEVAAELAPKLGAELTLVEVVDPGGDLPPSEIPESAEVRRIAESVDPPLDSWDVLHGSDVADTLTDHVDSDSRMALVLGTHGRSPGRRRSLGGVAAHTVRHSRVPVLLVSPEAVASRRAAAEDVISRPG